MKETMFTPEEREEQIVYFQELLEENLGSGHWQLTQRQKQQRAEAAFAAFDRTDVKISDAMDNALRILLDEPLEPPSAA